MPAKLKEWLLARAPDRFVDWRKRRALKREIRRLDADFDKQEAAASGYRKMEIHQDRDFNMGWPEAALGELETKRLWRRAQRRGLEIPQDEGWWTHHRERSI